MAATKPQGGGAFNQDVERLFQHDGAPVAAAPPVYASTATPADMSDSNYHPRGGSGSAGFGGGGPANTLDEPVWETIKRDLHRIGGNLILVVFPFKNRDQQSAALRNWDLWGPMAFTLVLAICLSIGSPKPSAVFSFVFGTCAAGAVVLTVNVVLLGGNIGFFQSMCLLGYCLFPMDVAAIVTACTTNMIARWIVVLVGLGWASWASVPFIGGSVSPARRALAVFPLLLLYTAMGWLALIKG
ncbi:g2994 [Coccomyxa viridis]|uniref:Protein YIP n=1 Tax=Coccomyxa viridis TaxID=1274662 RepID=A0ABP1FLR7_9CHLO